MAATIECARCHEPSEAPAELLRHARCSCGGELVEKTKKKTALLDRKKKKRSRTAKLGRKPSGRAERPATARRVRPGSARAREEREDRDERPRRPGRGAPQPASSTLKTIFFIWLGLSCFSTVVGLILFASGALAVENAKQEEARDDSAERGREDLKTLIEDMQRREQARKRAEAIKIEADATPLAPADSEGSDR